MVTLRTLTPGPGARQARRLPACDPSGASASEPGESAAQSGRRCRRASATRPSPASTRTPTSDAAVEVAGTGAGNTVPVAVVVGVAVPVAVAVGVSVVVGVNVGEAAPQTGAPDTQSDVAPASQQAAA